MKIPAYFALLPVLALSVSCLAQTDPLDRGWTGTWASAPHPEKPSNEIGSVSETIREIAHVSTAGQSIRVRISNEFGTEPLRIERSSVALRGTGDKLKTNPILLSFAGSQEVVIPAHESVVSDAAILDVPALSDVAVSVLVPAQTLTTVTDHPKDNTTNFIASGDQVLSTVLSGPDFFTSQPFLTDIDVRSNDGEEDPPRGSMGAVVCLGDSITAGHRSTLNGNDSWPDRLADRLQAESKKRIGVLNEGIGGNRVLQAGIGPSALSRFGQDVLKQTNVKYLIISEGINDVGLGYGPAHKAQANQPTASELESAYTEMARRAHADDIKVMGATITPFGHAGYFSEIGDSVRLEVNEWIRTTALTSHIYDEVVDFDHVLRAPNVDSPEVLNPLYDSGDGLHPNDAGYKAMADAIRLSFFDVAENSSLK